MANSKKILDPITDLFTGLDGGVAFATLYHDILPEFIKKAEQGSSKAKEVVEAFELVSKVCVAIQK